MNTTTFGALLGFLISVVWLTVGFLPMLIVLVATLIGAALGHWLTSKGLGSPKRLATAILNKIAN